MKFYNIETPRSFEDGVYCQECFDKTLQTWHLIKIIGLEDKYQCQVCGRRPNKLWVYIKKLFKQ